MKGIRKRPASQRERRGTTSHSSHHSALSPMACIAYSQGTDQGIMASSQDFVDGNPQIYQESRGRDGKGEGTLDANTGKGVGFSLGSALPMADPL